jgi:hypothetical protein
LTLSGEQLWKIAYVKEVLALLRISAMAKSGKSVRMASSLAKSLKARPKAQYQFEVLEVWTRLGGETNFSRHPTTGEIGGPLTRYFCAVTQPVHGGSPESLPDILGRYEAREATLEEIRLALERNNGEVDKRFVEGVSQLN